MFATRPKNLSVDVIVDVEAFPAIGIEFYVGLLFAILGAVAIICIIWAAYSRLCYTLFSLLYVAYDKEIQSRRNAAQAP